MAKDKLPLLWELYNNVYSNSRTKYCMICFRTVDERRLIQSTNVMKFKHFRYSIRVKKYKAPRFNKLDPNDHCVVCYMCDRQAAAAAKFCIALNLSTELNKLFSKMKFSTLYRSQVYSFLVSNNKTVHQEIKDAKEYQEVLEAVRESTNLLQTETLSLSVSDLDGGDKRQSTVEAPPEKRGKCRDLIRFETPVTDEDSVTVLNELSSPETMTKTIVLEEDDINDNEPHPVAIIHNTINADTQTHTHTDAVAVTHTQGTQQLQSGTLIPIIINNGSIIPLNNVNLSKLNLVINPLGNTQVPVITQIVNENQVLPINSNNQFIIPVNQGMLTQNNLNTILNMAQNSSNTVNNIPQNNSNNQNNTQIVISSVKSENMTFTQPSVMSKKFDGTTEAPVKIPAKNSLKRSDTECQLDKDTDSSPSAVKSGKIDWEDKIPMDVISWVKNQDRSKIQWLENKTYTDPVDTVIITDVKSICDTPNTSEDVIDLC